MKKITAIAATLLLTIAAFAQDGRSMYNRYSDEEGVSAVYISPAMFRLMGKLPDMNVSGSDVNVGSIVSALKGMYVLSSRNAKVNSALRSDAERFISKGSYELLMEMKDNGETVRMYTLGNEKTVTGFSLLAIEADEVTFINLDGQMPREALEKIIADSVK